MKTAIIDSGAMGSLYGGCLSNAGEKISDSFANTGAGNPDVNSIRVSCSSFFKIDLPAVFPESVYIAIS